MSVNHDDFRGVYYSDELSTAYTIVTRADTLIATHSRHSDIELSPTKEDTFAGNAWFFSQIEFIRDESNKINGCKVSSGRVRNLYFHKLSPL